jgi:hypothetical protein
MKEIHYKADYSIQFSSTTTLPIHIFPILYNLILFVYTSRFHLCNLSIGYLKALWKCLL